jgi:hypothetical protein
MFYYFIYLRLFKLQGEYSKVQAEFLFCLGFLFTLWFGFLLSLGCMCQALKEYNNINVGGCIFLNISGGVVSLGKK